MIQFILSISLVIFFILEMTLLRMLFAQQSKKIFAEIVVSKLSMPTYHELNAKRNEALIPNQVTSRIKDY